ncbi:hypothetical protein F8S13_22125 [Chloroflexia bacterium SDU3-3]|nr:hypothetical protein F8S13_22125 [Chloroflexia bacterium SDU3-3]
MRSFYLRAEEVRAIQAARRLTVERPMADPPLAQDLQQLIASSPFRLGERCWVREDWACVRAAGGVTQVTYRADGEPGEVAWRDAREMPQALARLHVMVVAVSVAQAGGRYVWAVQVRRVRWYSGRGHGHAVAARPQEG